MVHKRRVYLPPPPLDAYVPICWYTAVGVCAVRKFGFFPYCLVISTYYQF